MGDSLPRAHPNPCKNRSGLSEYIAIVHFASMRKGHAFPLPRPFELKATGDLKHGRGQQCHTWLTSQPVPYPTSSMGDHCPAHHDLLCVFITISIINACKEAKWG